MSMLVGDKLYKSTEKIAKAGRVIEELKAKVEFPNIRELVNSGQLDIAEVLKVRKKARRFRDWLQQGYDRDRDAIIAYHNEVARKIGAVRAARKGLSLFGVIGRPVLGTLVGTSVAGPAGGVLGIATGSASALHKQLGGALKSQKC